MANDIVSGDGDAEYEAEYEKAQAELAKTGYQNRKREAPVEDDKESQPTGDEENVEEEGRTGDEPAPEDDKSQLERLQRELEERDRKLRDTKAWADRQISNRDREASKLRKKLEKLKEKVPKAPILEEIEGLDEVITEVVAERFKLSAPDDDDDDGDNDHGEPVHSDDGPTQEELEAQKREFWNTIVLRGIPNLLKMTKEDPELSQKLVARRKKVGDEVWRDPVEAIRHMNEVILEHRVGKVHSRVQRDEDNDPLRVPGGTGGKFSQGKKSDESYDDVMGLDQESFRKRIERIKNKSR